MIVCRQSDIAKEREMRLDDSISEIRPQTRGQGMSVMSMLHKQRNKMTPREWIDKIRAFDGEIFNL